MTIYDIAEKSGVSIATVSRTLNGGKNVSEKTRKKVLSVIKEEGYTPNIFARGLGLDSIQMIGLLCTDVSDIYYAKAVSILENQLHQKGFDVLLYCSGSKIEDQKASLQLLLDKRVDAIILIGSAFQEESGGAHIGQTARQVPVFMINGVVNLPGVTCIACDEYSAVVQNISELYRQGARRILYLYDALTYSGRQKLEGYRDGLKACGLKWDEQLTVRVKKSLQDACKAVSELMDSGIFFDAVMSSEDLLAIGALKALQQKKIKMPIIGFNNSLLAECSTPSLTSIDNMLDTICPYTVNLLLHLLKGGEAPNKTLVSAKLIERETFRFNKNETNKRRNSP